MKQRNKVLCSFTLNFRLFSEKTEVDCVQFDRNGRDSMARFFSFHEWIRRKKLTDGNGRTFCGAETIPNARQSISGQRHTKLRWHDTIAVRPALGKRFQWINSSQQLDRARCRPTVWPAPDPASPFVESRLPSRLSSSLSTDFITDQLFFVLNLVVSTDSYTFSGLVPLFIWSYRVLPGFRVAPPVFKAPSKSTPGSPSEKFHL